MHPIYEHWLVPALGTIAGLAAALLGWLKIADWWTGRKERRRKK
jgi:hypothetical protein